MGPQATWASDLHRYSAAEIEAIGEAMWSKAGAEIQGAADTYQVLTLQREERDAEAVESRMCAYATGITGFLSFVDDLRVLDERTADVISAWELEERIGPTKLTDLRRTIRAMPLESLADRLKSAANENIGGGRPALGERHLFLCDLVAIWVRVRGRPPSKSRTSGPFPRFVGACFKPIAAESDKKGIPSAIGKAVNDEKYWRSRALDMG